jgi:hypothetical protein
MGTLNSIVAGDKLISSRDVQTVLHSSNYSLRAYPKSPATLNVIHAHAKCNIICGHMYPSTNHKNSAVIDRKISVSKI